MYIDLLELINRREETVCKYLSLSSCVTEQKICFKRSFSGGITKSSLFNYNVNSVRAEKQRLDMMHDFLHLVNNDRPRTYL